MAPSFRQALHGCPITAVLLLATVAVAGEPPILKIDVRNVQTASFDGWGCSLAWWAHSFGDTPDSTLLADLGFTTATRSIGGQELPGLGLSIVRYNIGASNPKGGERLATDAIPLHQQIPAFSTADPAIAGNGAWDWSADAAQRAMLRLAYDRGVRHVEFFSDSPPAWMCVNGNAGGNSGGQDNLAPRRVGTFVDYLTAVVQRSNRVWGIPVEYLEPFNEPSASWWKSPAKQEGCHFGVALQKEVLGGLEANAGRIAPTKITASDENDIDTAARTLAALDGVRERLSKVNVHGYSGLSPYRGAGRRSLRQAVGARKLWMSEYGDWDASGLTLAKSILLDLSELKPEGWVYWQLVDGGAWGLLRGAQARHEVLRPNRKWYAYAQFTRHLTSGCQILAGGSANLAAGWRNSDRRVVVVYLDEGTSAAKVLEVSGCRLSGESHAWRTILSPDGNLAYQPQVVKVEANRVFITPQMNALTTVELETR